MSDEIQHLQNTDSPDVGLQLLQLGISCTTPHAPPSAAPGTAPEAS